MIDLVTMDTLKVLLQGNNESTMEVEELMKRKSANLKFGKVKAPLGKT